MPFLVLVFVIRFPVLVGVGYCGNTFSSDSGFGNYGGNFAMCRKLLNTVHRRKADEDVHGWIIDSAAKINLTPHLNRLKRYSRNIRRQQEWEIVGRKQKTKTRNGILE